jgi:amidase
VKDAAYLLTYMAGRSDRDERTWSIPLEPIPNFTAFCKGTGLSGNTIGVSRNIFSADPTSPMMVAFESALRTLSVAGATVVDNSSLSAAEGFKKLNQQVRGIVRSSEFKREVVQYLETLKTNPNNIFSVEDIIEFTKTSPGKEYPEHDIGKFL